MSDESKSTVSSVGVALAVGVAEVEVVALVVGVEDCVAVGVDAGVTKDAIIDVKMAMAAKPSKLITTIQGQAAGFLATTSSSEVVVGKSAVWASVSADSTFVGALSLGFLANASARWARTKAFFGRSSGLLARQFNTKAAT